MNQPTISTDTQYLQLNNQLQAVKVEHDKQRPAVYALFGLVCLGLAYVISLLFLILALASFAAAVTAASKRSNLEKQYNQLVEQINALVTARGHVPPQFLGGSSVDRLKELQGLLDQGLITPSEFESKRADVIKSM